MVDNYKTSFLQKIFSIRNDIDGKILTILGFNIRLDMGTGKARFFDSFQDAQMAKVKKLTYPECIEQELKKIQSPPEYLPVDVKHNFLNILLNIEEFTHKENAFDNHEVYLCWEIRPVTPHIKILKQAQKRNKKVLFVGDSFLRSATTFSDKNTLPKYQKGISFTVDDITSYFDATRPSRLENILNDKSLILTDEQKQRARDCIDKIVQTNLTKYNHQPIFEPQIGRKGVKKVLVVDQTYGDMSIKKGLGGKETFKNMLSSAIKENPDADIIVKTHPDVIVGAKGGYYTDLVEQGNIYKMTDPINPISLIKYADKVYVCSTQLGFEALMCGKETHVFGMPFYAGWGLTNDRQKCKRRKNTRTLEEVFYLTYITYSYYVNPETKKRCEIEEAMDYLLELRDEYFNEKNFTKHFFNKK